jgi:ribose transport system permease protein
MMNEKNTINLIKKTVQNHSSLFGLIVLVFIASLINENFFNVLNLSNILRQASMIGVVAIGMTFVILIGGIDLSVGATVALTAMFATLLSESNIVIIILVPVIAGALIGLLNGTMISSFKVQPFIATLSIMLLVRGLAFVVSDGESLTGNFDSAVSGLARLKYLGVPVFGLIFIGIALVTGIFLSKTSFGNKIYAVGGNKEAARMMGVNVSLITIVAYVICGAFSGFAGFLTSIRTGSALPYSAEGWEMTAIAAVVIGGARLSGGVGKISGTVFGILIFQVIANSINLQGTLAYWYVWFVTGILLLIVILLQKRMEKGVLKK